MEQRGTGRDPEQGLQSRVRRFASLRAAQRALGRAVHPSELEQANRLGRSILIALEGLRGQGGGFRGALPEPAALARVDEMLDEAAGHIRVTLNRLPIPALRAALQDLSGERLVEAQGLIDLMLDAGLPDSEGLRMLEYLVTLASSEDRHGRRVVVREAAQLSPRLRELCQKLKAEGSGDPLQAERLISQATMMLHADEDLGGVRDRMRQLKEEIGHGIFHPRVLEASVSYNVAMWNRVADLIEGSRSIDMLAGDLFGDGPGSSDASDASGGEPEAPLPSARELLASPGFARLVAAVGVRLRGGSSSDAPADRCAVAASREGLRPGEIEVFDRSADGDEVAELARAAVVVGLVLRNGAALQESLAELGLDPEALRSEAASGLADELATTSRKLFEQGRHQLAFLISEVRSRHLAELLRGSATGRRPARSGSDLAGLLRGPRAGALAALVTLFALALAVSTLWTSGHRSDAFTREQLAALSPFLESGYRNTLGETNEFVGSLTPAWDYLSPEQRLRVTAEIGLALRDAGVQGAVLKDRFHRVNARFARGRAQLLDPTASAGP